RRRPVGDDQVPSMPCRLHWVNAAIYGSAAPATRKVGAQALQAVLHLLPHLCIQRRRRLDR
ncbi:MAG TPA: hypothetical protein VF880_04110, partial [Actinomycetes bacterium]